jgi:ABC-2 type transport system ATP-binding protein
MRASGNADRSEEPTRAPVPPAPAVPVAAAPVAAAPAGVLVRTDGLTRDYGGGAGLFDVDLRVPDGCVYGLVGPNGAGKTTLLSILTGLRRADRGTVHLGVPRGAVAVCPDVPEFEPWLTAFEVVDLARYYVAPDLDADAVRLTLDAAGLAQHAERRVGGFSRGMTQRLGLAAALVGNPRLLLLDEPTSALDPAGRAEILDLVAAMRGHRTVIFSSHILADVQRVADRVGILRAGRLISTRATRPRSSSATSTRAGCCGWAARPPRWWRRCMPDRGRVGSNSLTRNGSGSTPTASRMASRASRRYSRPAARGSSPASRSPPTWRRRSSR